MQRVLPSARTPDKNPPHLQPGFHTLNSTQFLQFIPSAASRRIDQQKLRHRTSCCQGGQHIPTTLGVQHKQKMLYDANRLM
jgi:hypothetical protein